jgi:hypothetical protein
LPQQAEDFPAPSQQQYQPPNFSHRNNQQPILGSEQSSQSRTDTSVVAVEKPDPSGGNEEYYEEDILEEDYTEEEIVSQKSDLDASQIANMVAGVLQEEYLFKGARDTDDSVGTFNGGSYRMSHRDTNTLLTIQLAIGCPLTVKSGGLSPLSGTKDKLMDGTPGAMIAMSPTLTLRGSIRFSLKGVISGTQITQSTITGPGEVLVAPPMLGDIATVQVTDGEEWSVGKDAFLASTQGITRDMKRQGIGKAIFSGEGLFVFKIGGVGTLWITSFGAIVRKDVR